MSDVVDGVEILPVPCPACGSSRTETATVRTRTRQYRQLFRCLDCEGTAAPGVDLVSGRLTA